MRIQQLLVWVLVLVAGCGGSVDNQQPSAPDNGTANQPPVISGTPSTTVTVNNQYQFSPTASDPDPGDTLTYAILNTPSWASFNSDTGTLTGTPTNSDVGNYTGIVVTVSDGQEETSLATFNIQVVAANSASNHTPRIFGSPELIGAIGVPYTFAPKASDADDNTLVFSASNLPSWVSLNATTGEMTGTPTVVGPSGDIEISVSDGTHTATLATFNISVTQPKFVDNALGAGCTTYNVSTRSCGSGSYTAFNSFSTITSTPGDVILVRAGTFNQALIVNGSGTANQPILYRNYPNETVTITGASLRPAINVSNRQYVIIDGFVVTDVSRWLYLEYAERNIIRNNRFIRATDAGGGAKTGIFFREASYNHFINNYLDDNPADSISLVNSNRNLVEGNTMYRALHALWDIRCGNFNVIRNNFMHNEIQKIGEVYDCDNTAGYAIYDATKHNLIEDNEFAYTPSSGNASAYSGIQYAGQNGIIRNNVFRDTVGPGLRMAIYGNEARNNYGNRVYHNVFYGTDYAGIEINNGTGSFYDNIIKNNIAAESVFVANDTRWWTYTGLMNGNPVQVNTSRLDGFLLDNNVFFSSMAATNYFVTYQVRDTGNYDINTLDQWASLYPALFQSNSNVDPQFTNVTNNDFTLAPGSSLRDSGVFLTQTVGNGTGVELIVGDASYFYDGFNIPGEIGDEIQLEGQTATAIITNIDYNTNTLTLDQALSWNDGQGVALAFTGSAPDIGLMEK